MPLSISGSADLNRVNLELGLSGTASITLNDSGPRNLAGISSGQISMNDLRGTCRIDSGYLAYYTTYGNPYYQIYGYWQGNVGSMSQTTFPDGKTLYYVYDGGGQLQISISGFSSSPGATGYFTSVKRQGGSTFNASSATYSYSAGYAYWTWATAMGLTTSGYYYLKFS